MDGVGGRIARPRRMTGRGVTWALDESDQLLIYRSCSCPEGSASETPFGSYYKVLRVYIHV